MPQRDDVGVTPQLDFEGRKGLLPAPNAIARWMGPLNASGLEAERVRARRVTSNFGRSR
jgi:hypothetical protein